MLAAFFESIKFIGHLIPVSFLRIYLGYVYLEKTIFWLNTNFIQEGSASVKISQALQNSSTHPLLIQFAESWVLPYWSQASFLYVGLYLAISLSYLFGYLVRPMAYLAALLAIIELGFSMHPQYEKLLIAIHIFLGWIGAGRVLGFDYYFYKRYRGLFW